MSHTPSGLAPPALRRGDTIGFFSPSSPATHFAKKRTARACNYLIKKGFKLKEGALTGEHDHYRSGSILARAEELNALLRDPDVRGVLSTIGGSNSNAILPHLDYDALRRDPKIFCGYSDVTAIHCAIHRQCDLITFYGPALTASLGELEPIVSQTWRAFQDLTFTPHLKETPYTLENPASWTEERLDWETQDRAKTTRANALLTLTQGRHTGRLIGGNLNTMSGLWGTPYEPDIRPGDILLIEDSLKDAATMERLFARLHNSGVLDQIGGLILGKHELFDDCGTGRRPHDLLLEVVGGELPCPALAEYDCAHTHPMLTLPLLATVTLDATAQRVTILHDCVH